MIDESFDTEQMKEPAKPWEFRSKPAWQRLIIMLGGVTVNFLLGFLIYALSLWTWGEVYLPTQNLVYGVQPDSLGLSLGLLPGDKVLAVDTITMERFNPNQIKAAIVIHNAANITVERDGQQVVLPISRKQADDLSDYSNKDFDICSPRIPFIIGQFALNSPAEKAGLLKGDRIISLDGRPTPFYQDFFDALTSQTLQEHNVQIQVERQSDGNSPDTLAFSVTTGPDGKIGAGAVGLETSRVSYSLVEALPAGVAKGTHFLSTQIKAFGQMVTGNLRMKDSLGSFITIGSMFPATWDWEAFWQLTAMLSLVLAFINLLPIPALDGGHVVFLLFEVVTGKKPSDKVMEISTMVGFVILISIMVLALGLDISRIL
jgi:regulator of sigma E protease